MHGDVLGAGGVVGGLAPRLSPPAGQGRTEVLLEPSKAGRPPRQTVHRGRVLTQRLGGKKASFTIFGVQCQTLVEGLRSRSPLPAAKVVETEIEVHVRVSRVFAQRMGKIVRRVGCAGLRGKNSEVVPHLFDGKLPAQRAEGGGRPGRVAAEEIRK